MLVSDELGQGSELRLVRVGSHALQGLKVLLISEGVVGDCVGDGAAPLTRVVRAGEPVDGEYGCSVESAPVDQMELLKGVVADHGLQVFPRNDCGKKSKTKTMESLNRASHGGDGKRRGGRELTAVGAVGDPELLGQECRGSLLGMSQMAGVNSGQLG